MNIPTEYYEEEFLDFENNCKIETAIGMTGNQKEVPQLLLDEYAKFQQEMKKAIKTCTSHDMIS